MIYSHEVEMMCPVAQGANHGPAPIPEEAKWVQAKEIKDISGLTHGVGWCAPQQGTCKLTQMCIRDSAFVYPEAGGPGDHIFFGSSPMRSEQCAEDPQTSGESG